MTYVSFYSSPIGDITLAVRNDTLVGVWFTDQKYYGAGISDFFKQDNLPLFAQVRDWLDKYFAGLNPTPGILPLAPCGTEFQRNVWNQLLQIPYGQTVTYGYIARRIGINSAQAIGGAVGRNPISVIIPCHRVIGVGGKMTGYAGGLERKSWLLMHECNC